MGYEYIHSLFCLQKEALKSHGKEYCFCEIYQQYQDKDKSLRNPLSLLGVNAKHNSVFQIVFRNISIVGPELSYLKTLIQEIQIFYERIY